MITDDELNLYNQFKNKSIDELFDVINKGKCIEKREAGDILTVKGGSYIFQQTCKLIGSDNPHVRAEAVHILGQLGTPERPFKDNTTPLLIELLEKEKVEFVQAATIAALGHLGDPLAVKSIIKFSKHRNQEIRHMLAFALGSFDGSSVITTLLSLLIDEDAEVRSWATFSLGVQNQSDSTAIREALFNRLTDENPEVRGEAYIGLANRKDERVVEPIIKELEGEFHGNWAVEAAEILAHRKFHKILVRLKKRVGNYIEEYFIEDINRAIAACKPK